MNITKLPDSELLIMMIIWNSIEDPDLMTVTRIAKERYGKIWKLQTVATFMTRLEKRGFITIYRIGRYSHYKEIITHEEYTTYAINETNAILFDNDVTDIFKYVNKVIASRLEKEFANKTLKCNENWSEELKNRKDLSEEEKQLVFEALEGGLKPEDLITSIDSERNNICCHTSLVYGDIDYICSIIYEKVFKKVFQSDNFEYVTGPDEMHKSLEDIIASIYNEKQQWFICGFSYIETERLLHMLIIANKEESN